MCKNIKKDILIILAYFILAIVIIFTFSTVFVALMLNDNTIKALFSFTLVMSIILIGPSLLFILIINIFLNPLNIIKKEKNIKKIIKIKKAAEYFFMLLIIIIFISALLSGI